jgi:hypothetical protein
VSRVYRIYTEELNKDEIIRLTAKQFESFTLEAMTGYTKGKSERSMVLEFVDARKKDVAALAKSIRRLNGQKSVPVMGLSGKIKKIGSSEK